MLKDVIDGLKIVSEGIESVQTIAEAVKSGKDYLKANHKEAQGDMKAMIGELGKSILMLKKASAVLTNFRFAIYLDTQGDELGRFNDYLIKSKIDNEQFRQDIESLRTHCSKVRSHAAAISESATAPGLAQMFGVLLRLRSPEREKDLGEKLDKLAFEEFEIANSASRMLDYLEKALQDVQDALGLGGAMHPQNIPAAAALLADYGTEFSKIEVQAMATMKDIEEVVKNLE